MKGIILAGDSGERLHPLTSGVPKSLLPIYDRPMVYYPLSVLLESGITEILVITTNEEQDVFRRSLGNGRTFGAHISFACQEKPEGIAQAIMIGREFIGSDSLCLVTGDTIIQGNSLQQQLSKAYKAADKSGNATIFVDQDYDPTQYGMVVLGEKGHLAEIAGVSSKPNYYSITGIYVFPNSVLKHIFKLEKSERNRYEITSVSKVFQSQKKLQIQKLPSDCTWLDTSTVDGLINSSLFMQKQRSL